MNKLTNKRLRTIKFGDTVIIKYGLMYKAIGRIIGQRNILAFNPYTRVYDAIPFDNICWVIRKKGSL